MSKIFEELIAQGKRVAEIIRVVIYARSCQISGCKFGSMGGPVYA